MDQLDFISMTLVGDDRKLANASARFYFDYTSRG